MAAHRGLIHETLRCWFIGGFWRTNHGYNKMFVVMLCIVMALFGLATVAGAPLLTVEENQRGLRLANSTRDDVDVETAVVDLSRVVREVTQIPQDSREHSRTDLDAVSSWRHRRDNVKPSRHTRNRQQPPSRTPRRRFPKRTTAIPSQRHTITPRHTLQPQPPCFDDVSAKTYLAGTVFEGKARSRSPLRNGAYNVTFVVQDVFKGGEAGFTRSPVRLQFLNKEGDVPECSARAHTLVRASITRGGKYIVFVDKVGPHSFVARGEPVLRSKATVQAVRDVLCQNCVRKPSLSGMGNVTLKAQEKLRLICKTRGNPLPLLHWYKDGSRINPDAKGTNIKIRNKNRRRTTLAIPKLRPEDAGRYECRATSVTGVMDRIFAQVTVSTDTRQDNTTILWRIPRPCPIEHYCMNEGTCTYYDTVGELSCSCAEGFKGTRCEEKDVYNHANGKKRRRKCRIGSAGDLQCSHTPPKGTKPMRMTTALRDTNIARLRADFRWHS